MHAIETASCNSCCICSCGASREGRVSKSAVVQHSEHGSVQQDARLSAASDNMLLVTTSGIRGASLQDLAVVQPRRTLAVPGVFHYKFDSTWCASPTTCLLCALTGGCLSAVNSMLQVLECCADAVG